jgi:hypothetical protein
MLAAKIGFYRAVGRYASLRAGLVAFWPMNELATSGNVSATDATGRGNTLTASGSPVYANGKVGAARNFVSSSSQYLWATSNSDLQFGNGDWTISLWAANSSTYTGSSNIFQHVIGKDQSGGREFGLRTQINATGTLCGYTASVFRTNGSELSVQFPGFSTKAAFTGVWNHIAVVHNSGTVTVYFNYSQTATGSRGAGNTFATTSTPFNIGRRSYSGFLEYFDGQVDEIGKWNRALTASEIQAIYNSGRGIDIYADTDPVSASMFRRDEILRSMYSWSEL